MQKLNRGKEVCRQQDFGGVLMNEWIVNSFKGGTAFTRKWGVEEGHTLPFFSPLYRVNF